MQAEAQHGMAALTNGGSTTRRGGDQRRRGPQGRRHVSGLTAAARAGPSPRANIGLAAGLCWGYWGPRWPRC